MTSCPIAGNGRRAESCEIPATYCVFPLPETDSNTETETETVSTKPTPRPMHCTETDANGYCTHFCHQYAVTRHRTCESESGSGNSTIKRTCASRQRPVQEDRSNEPGMAVHKSKTL